MPEITDELLQLQQDTDAAMAATEGGGDGHIERTAAAAMAVQKLYDAIEAALEQGDDDMGRLKFKDAIRAAARGE